MNNRTLVHVVAGDGCIRIQTYSRNRKSPHWFYVLCSRLEELEQQKEVIVQDINSFAVFRRNVYDESLEITFTWLSNSSGAVFGHLENIVLPYDKLVAFIRDSTMESTPSEWKILSLQNSRNRPKLIFNSSQNLHAALMNGVIRRKLVRFLCNKFNWPDSERIVFRDDFVPYSFVFQEFRNGKSNMVGGLILHRQEDLKQAYYGIHT